MGLVAGPASELSEGGHLQRQQIEKCLRLWLAYWDHPSVHLGPHWTPFPAPPSLAVLCNRGEMLFQGEGEYTLRIEPTQSRSQGFCSSSLGPDSTSNRA